MDLLKIAARVAAGPSAWKEQVRKVVVDLSDALRDALGELEERVDEDLAQAVGALDEDAGPEAFDEAVRQAGAVEERVLNRALLEYNVGGLGAAHEKLKSAVKEVHRAGELAREREMARKVGQEELWEKALTDPESRQVLDDLLEETGRGEIPRRVAVGEAPYAKATGADGPPRLLTRQEFSKAYGARMSDEELDAFSAGDSVTLEDGTTVELAR